MTAIQLELFPVAPTHIAGAPAGAPGHQPVPHDAETILTVNLYDTDGRVCARSTIDVTMTLDPCRSCPFRDICSEDSCGQKLYDVDVQEQEYEPFEEWLSAPLY